MKWLGEKVEALPAFVNTLLPCEKGDMLELDELWSFVQSKAQTLWLWVPFVGAPAGSSFGAWATAAKTGPPTCGLPCHLPPALCHPQRSLARLSGRFSKQNPPLLRQSRGRNLSRRTLVLHAAPAGGPLGQEGSRLLQVRRKPPRRYPPLHHHLQPRPSAASNNGLNTTHAR